MAVDPEEGLITDFMLGLMVVFGADIIVLVGFLWLTGHVSTAVFVRTTGLIVAGFASWIVWRWRGIRRIESTDTTDQPDRTPIDELKYQYAAGELSEVEFERKLDQLIETDETVDDSDHEAGELSVELDDPS
jgi:hypothetical protein